MTKGDELRYGAPRNAVHLCVDMQQMFAGGTDWTMPWLPRVLPNVVAITSADPERTIFTRFIPAQSPGQGAGMWRRYYERWSSMTIDTLGPEMVDLVKELARFVPPARTLDKYVYSPWTGSALHAQLREAGVETVVVTGGETDVPQQELDGSQIAGSTIDQRRLGPAKGMRPKQVRVQSDVSDPVR
ncbi:nicotinamidase-related amidase [Bradyrhizobium japonicum]|uniref:Nicotinamidase-related amidase n=1 Tax=Bradyrhizobium japonicum TaxID=375 RepID=A0ABV2RR10_BRAJP|nr:isochorismatase family cysteine hydrolase [Bradyrhizobium japonicum]WLB17383.1 isochorismatase family cysteine hydrolase [Bradyrhizobium japonicum]